MATDGTLYDYWLAIYRRRITVLVVSISAAVFAYVVSLVLPPVYETRSIFYMPILSSTPLYTAGSGVGQVERAPLMPVAEEKIAGVHLGILKSDEISTEILKRFPEKTPRYLFLNVDFVLSEHFLTEIYVRDRDPEIATAIANTYPAVYKDFHRRSIAERSKVTAAALEKQLGETRQLLNENMVAQQRHRDLNTSVSVTMASLQAEHKRLTELIDTLQENLIEARLQSENPAVELVLVERPEVPDKPAFPRPILNTVVSLLFGLVGGCYYALLLEYLAQLRRYRIGREMDATPLASAEGESA